ncbi:hypothetical protein BB560_003949 [Smittium megazygosporum]|uniref:serine C-palmitoyltransferase n=1 Tax=Smittium megazygosporum TaxID=133381 RepID=A0A2T9ZAL8_9FUNG|nr:hypothetical protein BB560_003949 [Smittium megazygosporum]
MIEGPIAESLTLETVPIQDHQFPEFDNHIDHFADHSENLLSPSPTLEEHTDAKRLSPSPSLEPQAAFSKEHNLLDSNPAVNSASPTFAPTPTPEDLKAVESEVQMEKAPLFTLITTYAGFLLLITLAHVRDFFGKLFYSKQYVALYEQNGYAPIISDFESLWNRRLYTRISDVLNVPITGVAGGYVNLLERVSNDHNRTFRFTGRKTQMLNLASYNYLGFAQSTGYCADQVEQKINELGLTSCTSRAHGGYTSLLAEAEAVTAEFLGVEDSIIISMGYATNSSVLPAVVSKGCLIISDSLNHSSLVSGSRLSGASISVFKHNDVSDLERVLRTSIAQGQPRTHRPWRKILVVVEGLYSMEGEICNLKGIIQLKRKYNFYLFVDEAHSIGAVGPHGKGVCDHFGLDPKDVDLLMGTFTKSFGAVGGYIAGKKPIIDRLRLFAHSSVYAETMPVPVLEQCLSSLRLLMDAVPEHAGEGKQKIDQLASNSEFFMRRLKEMGFMVLGSKGSPVVPVLLFNPGKIQAFSHECRRRKIAVVVVSYPATPIISGRVRFCLSASHSRKDIEYALECIDEIGDILGIKLLKNINQ